MLTLILMRSRITNKKVNYFNPFCTFQDMARTGNNYEKLLRGDNSINRNHGSWVLPFPRPYYHLSIYQVLYKCQELF